MRNARIRRLLADARGRKAWAIYNRRIKRLRSTSRGSYAAVDVASGDYAVASTALEAIDRVCESHPRSKPYVFKIGGLDRYRTWSAR